MPALHSAAFGALLRRYRGVAGLTQEELAERAGLSVRAVSDLERGVKTRPRRDTVDLLAAALGLEGAQHAAFAAARGHGVRPGEAAPGASAPASIYSSEIAPPLVGRTGELALLERHLAGEGPPVLLLAGEPGIGKSRLLREAARRAPGHGWRVLEGGCQRRGGQEPYAPILQALEGHIHAQPPAQLRTSLRGCAWLVRLLPELADGPIEPLPAWSLPPEQERRLLFRAVARYLANSAGTAGTLLLLDDVQWAGPDAFDLLGALVLSGEAPLRAMGAYRDTEVGATHPLSSALADLAHAGRVTQHTLGPLSPQDAAQMLDSLLESMDGVEHTPRERMLQRTGGVPFFLVSCVQALRAHTSDDVTVDPVPWSVAQGIRQRLAALPISAQEALEVASVVGRQAPRALLGSLSARSEEEVLAALETAARARLLLEEDADGYRFAHDVIREVVEGDLSAARRAALHRRVAEALEEAGARSAARLAYHFSRGGDDNKAVSYLELAGDRAIQQHANVEAEHHYRVLADRLDALGRAADVARARHKLGAVLHILGRFDAALAALEPAARAADESGDRESLTATLALIGRVHANRGTAAEGLERLLPLLERLASDKAPPGAAALYTTLAHLFFVSGRTSEQLPAAIRAVELARAENDAGILAMALGWLGVALHTTGRHGEAISVMDEAVQVAEAGGALATLVYILHTLAHACVLDGEFERGSALSKRAGELAEQLGDAMFAVFYAAHHAFALFLLGHWDQAHAEIERSLALSRQLGPSFAAPYPLFCLGYLHLAAGNWDEAAGALEESSALAEQTGDRQALRLAQGVLAERDLLAGQPDAAAQRLAPLLDPSDLDAWEARHNLPLLALAYLDKGDAAHADELAAQVVARTRATGERLVLVDALRVQAMIALRQARWPEAAASLEEALALARAIGYPYAEGRLLHTAATMCLLTEQPALARERLEAALAIFRRLGARKDAEQAEEAIAGLV